MTLRPFRMPAPVVPAVPDPAAVLEHDLLTVKQVAVRLGLKNEFGVYRAIQTHNLPIRRIGRAIRICPVELEAWTRRNRSGQR